MTDVFLILQWWFMLFLIGAVFLQLTAKIFSSFFDKGYIFAKILGIAILSYVVFLLGFLHILPFTRINTLFILCIFFLVLGIRALKIKEGKLLLSTKFFFLDNKTPWRLFFFEEVLFLVGLFFWSFIRSFSPDINGLEKFMDFGFINSILRADFFPPKDMWLTPFSINYYYFGHLAAAVLTKLSGISSNISYNLMLATIFGLCFTASFSIGANLINQLKIQNSKLKTAAQNVKVLVIGGLLTAFLVTLAGNLHTIYAFFKPYENEKPVPVWELGNPIFRTEEYVDKNGLKQIRFVDKFSHDKNVVSTNEYLKIIPNIKDFPNGYWYPNATRFIYNTIHEFPTYSWVVADLHGHVLDIPFVLLTIALLLSLFSRSIMHVPQAQNAKLKNQNHNSKLKNYLYENFGLYDLRFTFLLAFMLAIMYMTNAWDGIIYFLFAGLVLLCLQWKRMGQGKSIVDIFIGLFVYLFVIGIGFILVSLPFSIEFKPFVSGIGVLCAPDFLIKMKHLGPFLFEADHCQRSPWWQLLILYGFFYFFVISFIIFVSRKREIQSASWTKFKIDAKRHPERSEGSNTHGILRFAQNDIVKSDIFIFLLIVLSTILIIIPEFIYVKDIYPAHYRANTMFKLVFQSFIMLSIASGYILVRLISNMKYQKSRIFNFYSIFLIFSFLFLILVFIYPYYATRSYYGDLKTFHGLDGTKYLKNSYPSDYEAIQWINKTIKGQPVILEAQGDSYTDYARISANTGLPTVLGWTVHEWLWRGTYDVPAPRIDDVRKMYEEADGAILQNLIKKYDVQYVFLGDLERKKYTNINEDKWGILGRVVFQDGNTKIYQLN